MDLKQANVLITGGSEGIGLGLATRFLKAGSRVIITGRNQQKLEKAMQAYPGLEIFINDIGNPLQREKLAEHIGVTMSRINVLIVNVTSGGAHIPQVFAPVYSARKAALHSYTITLRHALAGTNCQVAELIPPAVQTALAGPGLNHGALPDEFCDIVFPLLMDGKNDAVGFGPTADLVPELSGKKVEEFFEAGAARFPVLTYQTDI